ncbi:hypothetical protein [Citrobacter koseri]|uniref:hypothetical protein n=1 Tax=Citrobacter koseri TaxID=545 RepID=UPI0023B35418|nr:hypothetical protein [Citrobacter koseri]MDE9579695.1 hypothetical protein [Citrobacter koseri]
MVSPGVILFGPVLMAKTERYRSDAITVGRGIAKKIFPLFVLKWNTEKFITFHSGTINPKKRQDCDPDPFSLLIMHLKKGNHAWFSPSIADKTGKYFSAWPTFLRE